MPPQILRLVILTAGVVGSYGIARVLMVPPTFGDYGSFRGAALEELAAAKPVLSGMKVCEECHTEEFEALGKYEHKEISCEACHGPSRKHANDPDVKTPRTKFADADCLRCHMTNPSRPVWLKQVDSNDHYRGDKRCSDCHMGHQPNEKPTPKPVQKP